MSHFVAGVVEVKNDDGYTESDSSNSQGSNAKWHAVLRIRPLFIHSSYLDTLEEFKEKRIGIESDASPDVYLELEHDITIYKRDSTNVTKKEALDALDSKKTYFVNTTFSPVSYKFDEIKNHRSNLSQGKLLHQLMADLAGFYGERNIRLTIWIGLWD